MSLTGTAESGPVKLGVPVADLMTGMYATVAALAGLRGRDCGRGPAARFEVPLFECALTTLIPYATLYRLRYVGSAHHRQVAIYQASHDDYQNSIFPSGLPIGICQDALDLACGLFLDDPTAWQDLGRRPAGPGRLRDQRR